MALNPRLTSENIRTNLKNRILSQDCGGAKFKTAGILLYVEDFKRSTNQDIGPKDIFEMGSNSQNRMKIIVADIIPQNEIAK